MNCFTDRLFELSAEAADKDFVLPDWQSENRRTKTDVTIVAHSLAVGLSLEASEILSRDFGISCEVRRRDE